MELALGMKGLPVNGLQCGFRAQIQMGHMRLSNPLQLPVAVARSSPYLRHALTAPLGQQATSHARHTWLLADRD
jgi:hypothetical protein